MNIKIPRSKKQNFIIATLISIGILIALAPLLSLQDIFDPDMVHLEETYSYDYVNGSIELKMNFQQIGWASESETGELRIYFRLILSISSIGNLTVKGFTSYYHSIDVNSVGKGSLSQLLNLTETVTVGDWINSLSYGDNVTLYCNTGINFTLGTVPQNDVLNFQVCFQNTQQVSDYYSHEYDRQWQRVVFIIYFLLYAIIPIALFVIIKPYGISRSRVETEEDDEYTDFLEKKHEELDDQDNIR